MNGELTIPEKENFRDRMKNDYYYKFKVDMLVDVMPSLRSSGRMDCPCGTRRTIKIQRIDGKDLVRVKILCEKCREHGSYHVVASPYDLLPMDVKNA